MALRLDDATLSLNSDKPSERTAGIETYRQIFGKDSTLEALRGDDATWVPVFQALFHCVLLERAACTRKGDVQDATAILISRLEASTRCVRWLTERSLLYFERKTLKALVNHLAQMVVRDGKLLAPVTLDYFKSLHLVLSHPPHRSSLDQIQWKSIASLCFNAVLSRSAKADLPRVKENFWSDVPSSTIEAADSARPLGLEDIEQMGCLNELLSSPFAPLCNEERNGVQLLAQYTLFFEAYPAESSAHFPAISGLNKLLRQLELNEKRTIEAFALRCWRLLVGLWASKNKALKEQLIVTFRILLPHLTSPISIPSSTQAHTERDTATVAHLLSCLQRQLNRDVDNRFSLGVLHSSSLNLAIRATNDLLPVFQYPTFGANRVFTAPSAVSWAALELCADLVKHLNSPTLRAATRPAVSAADEPLTEVEEEPIASGSRKRASKTPAASGRTRRTTHGTSSPTPTPSKRRRVEMGLRIDALKSTLDDLPLPHGESHQKAQPRRVWTLQIILCLVSRHWAQLGDQAQIQIFHALQERLSDGDHEVQAWTMSCMAAIAAAGSPLPQLAPCWSSVWTICCRRINVAPVSRQAAAAATSILLNHLLDKGKYLSELQSLFADLDLSPPPFPWDSVCQFFSAAIELCSKDVLMARQNLEEKLASWLQSTWLPTHGISRGFQARARVPEQNSMHTLQLLGSICRLTTLPSVPLVPQPLPGCAVVDQVLYERETANVRTFLLDANVSGPSQAQASTVPASREASASEPQSDVSATRSETGSLHRTLPASQYRAPNALEMRCSNLLHRAMNMLLEEWTPSSTQEESAFGEVATVEQTRRSLDLAVVALLFEALLSVNYVRIQGHVALTSQRVLLHAMHTVAESNRWSVADRATLMSALQPLLQPPSQHCDVGMASYFVGLLKPGACSGVRREILSNCDAETGKSGSAPTSTGRGASSLLHAAWAGTSSDIYEAFTSSLQECLHVLCAMTVDTPETRAADDDEWGQIRHAKVDSDTLMKPADGYGADRFAVSLATTVCVQGLIEIPRVTLGSQTLSATNHQLDAVLLEGSLLAIDRAGDEIFLALGNGALKLTHRTATSIMTRLGMEYLPDYTFNKSEHASLIVLDFLQATMTLWIDPSQSDTDLAARSEEFCIHFAKALTKKRPLTWRTRIRAAAFFMELLKATIARDGWDIEEPDILSPPSIASLIYDLGRDVDMRVRFASAAMIARLFELCPVGTEEQLYVEATQCLSNEPDHVEGMLARSQITANVMTASSPLRAQAFFFLLEPCMLNKVTNIHARELLKVIATALGFASTRDMFLVFAAQLTFGLLRSGYDPTRLPYEVLGYSSMRQCLEHAFPAIGSMMAAMAVDESDVSNQFAGLARSIRKTELQGMAECLPFVLAIELVFAVRDVQEVSSLRTVPTEAAANMRQRLSGREKPLTTDSAISKTLERQLDQVVLALLMQFWERDCSADSEFVAALRGCEGPVAEEFVSLCQGVDVTGLDFFAHEPIRPHAPGFEVFQALLAASLSINDDVRSACAYHVIQQMLSTIWKEKLVNDQLRHLNALKLYLAMNSTAIRGSPVLLRTLLHGASTLMGQPDLLGPASGIVQWCLHNSTKLQRAPPQLSTQLIRLGEQADVYASSEDATLQDLGSKLFGWLEAQLLPLLRHKGTQRHAFDAVCAYPNELPKKLADLSKGGHLSLQNMTDTVLRNPRVSLNTHTLRRFKEALEVSRGAQEAEMFSRTTIWRLFSRLGRFRTEGASCAAAEIMADIIHVLSGKIKTPPAEQSQYVGGDDSLGLLEILLEHSETPYGPLKAFVALQVFEVQRGEDLALAEIAFFRLRAVLTQNPNFGALVSKWPDMTGEELLFLSAFPTTPISSVSNRGGVAPLSDIDVQPSRFDDWICALCSSLCQNFAAIEPESFYIQVSPLFARFPSLARKCLPALLHALLIFEHDAQADEPFRAELSTYFSGVLSNSEADKQAWSAIVNAVLYLRQQKTIKLQTDPLSSDRWLAISFFLLARRAIDCKLYTTALLFVELLREHNPRQYHSEQAAISELLYEVYSNVEDPDSFYAVVNADMKGSLVKRLHHEGEWQRAFELHAADFESAPFSSSLSLRANEATKSGLGFSLHEMGFNRLASGLSNAGAANVHTVDFEVAWRTDDWNLPVPAQPTHGASAAVYTALRALHRDRDPLLITETIEKGLSNELRGLAGAGVEGVLQVRRIARDLLSLREAKRWRTTLSTSKDLDSALKKVASWPSLDSRFEFDDFERVLAVRQSFLRAERNRAQTGQLGDMLEPATEEALKLESSILLEVTKAAQKHGKRHTAMNAVIMADKLNKQLPVGSQSPALVPEFASVLWSQGEHAIAMQALSESLQSMTAAPKSKDKDARKALLMARLGQWRATARSQQPSTIEKEFFRPAHELVQKDKENAAAVCYQYAVFADAQYRSFCTSDEVKQLELFVSHRQEEIRQNMQEMDRVGPRTSAYNVLRHHRNQAEKILRQDLAVLEQHRKSKALFLKQAFRMYAEALGRSDEHDDAVVRLTSLWFENAEDNDFNDAISESLMKVPAHKFLGLTHQLSSRLDQIQSPNEGQRAPTHSFLTNLTKLMARMCESHPFHCLYAIYALRKADTDDNASQSRAQQRSAVQHLSQKQRGAAAHALWHKVKSTSPHKARIVQFEKACDAYVEWAELDLKSAMPGLFSRGHIKSGALRFDHRLNLMINKLKDTEVPVATADLPVDPSGQYRDLPTIQRYSDVFYTAGGLHLPKIIECIANDGRRYKQLFKSNDDLRQDAVMQQVFTLLNGMLSRDQKASKRDLRIRTYIVLPLGPQCGLLEFVGNTSPIGSVLGDAHDRYRKEGELTPTDARKEIADVMGRTPSEKLAVFRKVCEKMPPVFRYYFLERFKIPPSWFGVRLNYTRSVATTSIIGHVLGLGDRHVSNILLDNVTGEVIHIDFGVAFEQGKLLPIPELVPFRLTRDLVDGMGLSGVEGVFRRCCEETLRVLRQNADVIKTVLEVFKYDPLWAWTSNPVKVLRAQRASDDEAPPSSSRSTTPSSSNTKAGEQAGGGGGRAGQNLAELEGRDTASLSAERAIGSVMSKLASNLSTSYTVNELIQTATDEGNLSAIFYGWQAAL